MPALTPANLVAYSLQVLVVVACGAALLRFVRFSAPAARLACLRILLIGCLALPFVQPLGPPEAVVSTSPARKAAEGTAAARPGDAGPGPSALSEEAVRAQAPPAARLGTWLAALLVAGSAGRLVWLAAGMAALGRLRRRASRLIPRPDAIEQAAALVAADADFRVSSEISRPVSFGARRAVVLLPSAFSEFPSAEQHAVACHELVHVRRLDWLRTVGDELVRAALWFHPAIWWLLDQVHLAREQVVDREVVELVGDRRSYLDVLLKLARLPMRPALRPVSAVIRSAHLPERVALLVKEAPMSRIRLLVGLAVGGAAVVFAGALAVQAMPLRGTEVATVRPGAAVGVAEAAMPTTAPASVPARAIAPASIEASAGAGAYEERRQATKPGVTPTGQQAPRPGMSTAKPAPKIVSKVEPVYPPDARANRVQGFVVLEARISPAGLVTDVKVLRSIPLLDQAAIDAVRQWRFEPMPTAAVFTTTIRFALDGKGKLATAEGVSGGVAGEVAGGAEREAASAMKAFSALKAVNRVEPDLGGGAALGGAESVVIVGGAVTTSGTVTGLHGISGAAELAQRAVDAVNRWTFVPPDAEQTLVVGFNAAAQPDRKGEISLKVGGGVTPPRKTKDVKPVYPPAAAGERVQGIVIIEATIGPDGKVREARVLRPIEGLNEAALTAVLQWEFTPTLLNGVASAVIMTVTVNFTLK